MIPRCYPVVLLLAAAAAARAVSFDPLLAHPNLWSLGPGEFQQAAADLPFRWTSNTRGSARAAEPGMTLFDLPVVEVIARFEGERIKDISANIYARGDAGDLTQTQFEALCGRSIEAVSKATAAKFTRRGKDPANAVKAEGLVWKTEKAVYTLEYSFTREMKSRDIPFRAEFVRLEIAPPQKSLTLLESARAPSRSRFVGSQHIQRDAVSGDVWLKDVPMVDQGQKGYCVVATAERVMRYYGARVDSNELAQIANTETEGGTNYEAMIGALRKVAARLKVRVREVERQDVRDILALIKDYNRAAKKNGAPEVPDQGNMIDIGAVYGAMKGEVLRETKTKNRADLGRFQRAVQAHVDQGIPLLWTVQLGLFNEPGVRQSGGGHMRLIIGYNSKTGEILFSDSWGAGHELKRIPAADAWTITTGVSTIEPT